MIQNMCTLGSNCFASSPHARLATWLVHTNILSTVLPQPKPEPVDREQKHCVGVKATERSTGRVLQIARLSV